jgi:hypothetical protein
MKAYLLFVSYLLIFFYASQAQILLAKPEYEPFQAGEKLVFNLSYAFVSAGRGDFEVKEKIAEIQGKKNYHISVVGKSYTFFDFFFKVRDYYTTYVDCVTKLPSIFIRDVSEGGYTKKEKYYFNQDKKEILADGQKFDKLKNEMFDLISCFYYVRCIDFSNKPIGYELDLFTFYEKEIFPVGMKFIGRSTLKTKLGTFKVLMFQPKLIEGRVFKNQSDMILYVSDDKNQVPLRIKSAVYLDYVYADLMEFKNLKYPLTSLIKK